MSNPKWIPGRWAHPYRAPGAVTRHALAVVHGGPRLRPVTSVLAVCIALGLSACGGGGSGVRSTPPVTGGGTPVDPPTVYVAEGTLFVQRGDVSKPVIMGSRSILDNAGTVGGPNADIGVSASGAASHVSVLNHDGGRIEGKNFGLQLWSAYPTIENTGTGTLIRSDGVAIEYIDDSGNSKITNSGGAAIRGGRIAIHLQRGGTIKNGAGSTIEATGTTTGDCGVAGSCSIYVNPENDDSPTQSGSVTILENAGTIIGNVQLDPIARNEVTLVAGGTIRGDLSMGGGSLMLAGDAGTTDRYSRAVTGTTMYSGGVTKLGEGTWILDVPRPLGSDLYEGYPSLQINAGTLQVGNGGTEGPSKIRDVYADVGARLLFNRSDDLVLDASFQWGGTIVQAGTGLLTLSLKDGSSVGLLALGAGSRVKIAHSPSTEVTNDGDLIFESPYNDLYWAGDISGTGSIIQNGSGNLTLGGLNTYTGSTVVNSGWLQLRQGLTGDLWINPEGAFAAGTADLNNYVPRIGGDLYNAGRIVLTQGDPIIWMNAPKGDVIVGGDYVQASTGTFSVTLGDKLDIAGSATLEGGTLEVRGAANGYIANQHTDVLTAAGGVTGTFDRLVKGPGVVFTATTIHYDANSVWLDTTGLDVTRAAVGDGIGYTAASMASAQRVQGAFEQLNERIGAGTLDGVSGDFLQAAGRFQQAPTVAAAQASLRSLSGEIHAASPAMTFRAIDAGNRALSDHLDDLRGGNGPVGLWTKRIGTGGSMARSGFDALGHRDEGWLAGSDHRIGPSGLMGFAFGEGVARQQLAQGFDHTDSRRVEGMVYAGATRGAWYAQGRLGAGSYRQDTMRQLLLGDAAEQAWTRHDGRYRMAYGEGGFRFGGSAARLIPFVSLEYGRNERGAFVEQGTSGFGLRSDLQALDRWQAGVGVRAARRWDFAGGRSLDFTANGRWRRTIASRGDAMDASFVGVRQWSPLSGIDLSRQGFVFNIGVNAQLSRSASLAFSYAYETSQYDSSQGLSALWRLAF
jgi:fibronectin-binding autotransporter adhesin